jgi:2-C-methyl-D-erythritol 4-phosphate cytidylyltransferase
MEETKQSLNIAIILAGGSGRRMGGMNAPKQFVNVYEKPILIHTLEVFDLHQGIDEIIVVCLDSYIQDLKMLIRKFELQKVTQVVTAGKTRQESSRSGVMAVSDKDAVIIVHDGVRPLISGRIIDDNIKAARAVGAVDTVIFTTDTIVKSASGKFMDDILNRGEIFLGQTPQSFRCQVLRDAHEFARQQGIVNASDDCQLVKKMGHEVALVAGDKLNLKVTTQEDLILLRTFVKMSKLRSI